MHFTHKNNYIKRRKNKVFGIFTYRYFAFNANLYPQNCPQIHFIRQIQVRNVNDEVFVTQLSKTIKGIQYFQGPKTSSKI